MSDAMGSPAPLVSASNRMVLAARELSDAYRTITEEAARLRHEAYRIGGSRGADEVARVAGCRPIAEEVLGVLLAEGLGALFENAGVQLTSLPVVPDLPRRWQHRLATGQTITARRLVPTRSGYAHD